MNLSEFRKSIRVFFISVRSEMMIDLQYRLNFVFSFLGTSVWLIGEILFLKFLLEKYQTIAGWNMYEIGLLLGTNQLWVGGLFYFIIWPSLITFSERIKNGDIDKMLTFPLHTRFYISTFKLSWPSLSIFFEGLALIVYCGIRLGIHISISKVFLYVILLLISGWIIYCIQYIGMCLVFWLLKSGSIMYLVATIDRLARYPYEIFTNGILFVFFTFVVPITIICNVPTRALLGILEVKFIMFSIIVAICFYIISNQMWKLGLRRYESGSS